jgi:hypothetical protein
MSSNMTRQYVMTWLDWLGTDVTRGLEIAKYPKYSLAKTCNRY